MTSEPHDPLAALLADAPEESAAPQQTLQSPLPVGVASSDDPLAGAGAESEQSGRRLFNLPGGVAVILLVAIVAFAVLVAMRQFGLGVHLNFVDVKLDYPVEASESLTAEHDKILKDLDLGVSELQVPLKDVQKNPFEIITDGAPTQNAKQQESPGERLRRELAERRKHVDAAFSKLRLQSVLAGRVPVARINKQTVREGDVVDDAFIVSEIRGRSVELESKELPGTRFTLTLGGGG